MPAERPDAGSAATISVVIAVYNGEALIGDAIASVLGQTLPPTEVIVVDDGSSDGTAAVVGGIAAAQPSVRCLRLDPNQGQAAALNRGVADAGGAYLAFLDADDVWRPDKLARQAGLLDARPELDVVYGMAVQRRIRPQADAAGAPEAADALALPAVPAYLPGAMLIRRAAFDRVGPFDTRWRLGSVVDWYARSVEAGLAQDLVPAVVYERRIHGGNLGIVASKHRTDYLGVVKAALDRRRRGPT
jgi:glycosyltransferase involved in cell wall biosynthesis